MLRCQFLWVYYKLFNILCFVRTPGTLCLGEKWVFHFRKLISWLQKKAMPVPLGVIFLKSLSLKGEKKCNETYLTLWDLSSYFLFWTFESYILIDIQTLKFCHKDVILILQVYFHLKILMICTLSLEIKHKK